MSSVNNFQSRDQWCHSAEEPKIRVQNLGMMRSLELVGQDTRKKKICVRSGVPADFIWFPFCPWGKARPQVAKAYYQRATAMTLRAEWKGCTVLRNAVILSQPRWNNLTKHLSETSEKACCKNKGHILRLNKSEINLALNIIEPTWQDQKNPPLI